MRLRRRRLAAVDLWMLLAACLALALLFVALFGERIAPHEAIYFVVEHGTDPRPYDPGLVFPFGSDVLGRDLFSLVLAGAGTTLAIVVAGGLARVGAGVLVAVSAAWWRPARALTGSLAELLSSVPATLVALVLVLVFIKGDRNVLVFIAALLVTGWAGPYRIVRAELDRLSRAPYTAGALAVGVGRWRLFRRHHLPHLVPVVAMNLSQQIVASLVLVAELGVLSVFVGATRTINIEESLSVVRTGPLNVARISDPPEWGGLLAGARTIESLWTTRWLIIVPGVAFAITAVAVAVIGFAIARRYARRDVTQDLRGRGAAALVAAVLGIFVASGVVPERYAAAREWAASARAEVRETSDVEKAFAAAGLLPLGSTFAVERETSAVVQTGPAKVDVGGAALAEEWPRPVRASAMRSDEAALPHARSFVMAGTGGGTVAAPLVYVGRGIVPSEMPPLPRQPGIAPRPDIGAAVKDYADDYAGVDIRGKVVLLVRFLGVAARERDGRTLNGYAHGLPQDESIARAIARGAAAVLFVDPAITLCPDAAVGVTFGVGELQCAANPYLRLERFSPPQTASGVPVVILDSPAAELLFARFGLGLSEFRRYDDPTPEKYKVSPSRDLGVTARVEVPLASQRSTVTSFAGEIAGAAPDRARVLVWSVRRGGGGQAGSDVLAAVARAAGARSTPMIFVEFDPAIDAAANAKAVEQLLRDKRISLVIVLDQLLGDALKFTTPHGELIPALDRYAERAGARYQVTRTTPPVTSLAGLAPFTDLRTVVVSGAGGGTGDLRGDAAALLGYLAGRLALGAEELAR